ncbi:MAG: ABC transporter permease [Bacillota bacterium]|nr:ABC transporter permease [Bacillota bacterium]MDW7683632.1 ABC transporter permease [Bacillota bacterium]
MKKIVWIALKDLLQASRDRKGLLTLIAMPMVLIAILGAAFGGSFSASPGSAEPFQLGFVNEDGGAMGDAWESFLGSEELASLIVPVRTTAEEARKHVAAGNLAAAIVVPSGFSENYLAGNPVAVELLKDRGRLLSPLIAESITGKFAESMGASQLVVKKALVTASVQPTDAAVLGEAVGRDLQALTPVIREELSEKDAQITSFQYYTAAMSVMFLLFAGVTGLQSILSEQRQYTFHRMHASPLKRGSFILGKFSGIVAIAFAQFLVLMVGTRLIYGVHWGSRPWQALLVGLSFAVAVSGLALMASSLIHEEKTLLAVWPVGVQISSALGGSMVPLAVFPPSMQFLARLTPNYWGLQGLLDVMTGRPLDGLNLLPLLAVGILALLVATARTAAA